MDDATRRDLLARIDIQQARIDSLVDSARPRQRRLATTAVLSSAVAAVLTAGPGFGGSGFADGVAGALGLSASELVWRTLCLAAVAVSVLAAITSNLSSNADSGTRIAAAELSRTELEGLRTLVEFDEISTNEAVRGVQIATIRSGHLPTPRD